MSTGSIPSCWDVIRCKLPNNALEEVSLPVSATPSHPRNVPKWVEPAGAGERQGEHGGQT
jgi:hypothetical protein